MSTIKDNILKILENINSIKEKNGINHEVRLMAVTKTYPAEFIKETLDCGLSLFGENRVIEAYNKYNSEILSGKDYELHIIGHLQRNKAKEAVKISNMIQSIDKIETLIAIEKQCTIINKKIDYLIEVNTSNESQKNGLNPDTVYEFLDQIYKNNLTLCNLRGLMTVGPLTNDKEKIKYSFKLLNNIFNKISEQIKKQDFNILSMGMSGDYEIAIHEGSNLVRIGTAIYGTR